MGSHPSKNIIHVDYLFLVRVYMIPCEHKIPLWIACIKLPMNMIIAMLRITKVPGRSEIPSDRALNFIQGDSRAFLIS